VKLLANVVRIVAQSFQQRFDKVLLGVFFRIDTGDAFAPDFLRAFNEFVDALWKLRMRSAIFARSRNRNKSEL
jgi:hypothetical protein